MRARFTYKSSSNFDLETLKEFFLYFSCNFFLQSLKNDYRIDLWLVRRVWLHNEPRLSGENTNSAFEPANLDPYLVSFFQNSLFFYSLHCAVSVISDEILSPKFFRCFSGITPAFGTEWIWTTYAFYRAPWTRKRQTKWICLAWNFKVNVLNFDIHL